MTNTPTLQDLQALNGKDFAMLTPEELAVLEFYRMQGRKFDVAVNSINKFDRDELARATSRQQADEIMMRAQSIVSIHLGPGAAEA